MFCVVTVLYVSHQSEGEYNPSERSCRNGKVLLHYRDNKSEGTPELKAAIYVYPQTHRKKSNFQTYKYDRKLYG